MFAWLWRGANQRLSLRGVRPATANETAVYHPWSITQASACCLCGVVIEGRVCAFVHATVVVSLSGRVLRSLFYMHVKTYRICAKHCTYMYVHALAPRICFRLPPCAVASP